MFPGLDLLSDKALIGFLKVVIEVNRDVQLLAYREDKRLSKGGENQFKLRMGFGMHAGWAIEGAVGSMQKVDATYLSPHVNMAARMEAATKQFGVSILVTESFYKVSSLLQESTLFPLRACNDPRITTLPSAMSNRSCSQKLPRNTAERLMSSQ